MISKNQIKEYKLLREQYLSIIDTSILERHNKIVQIGAYTAEVGQNNHIVLSRSKFPSQFTENSAQEILEIGWTSINDKAHIEIYNVRDWYKNKIKALDFIIKNFDKI
jgi:hypothetical protein